MTNTMPVSAACRLPLLLAAGLSCASALAQPSAQLDLPRTQLTAGMFRIDVQLATTPQQRQIGLIVKQAKQ